MLPISFSRNQLSAQVALQHYLILYKLARATYSFAKKILEVKFPFTQNYYIPKYVDLSICSSAKWLHIAQFDEPFSHTRYLI